MPLAALVAVSLISAALMGYAIQRGATCTVAAIGEIVESGTTNRLVALVEAALWVAGGLLVARQFGIVMALPDGFAASGWTIAGGALLGLGAWLNRACVFGAIGRLGSGEWAYVATPIGFYLGATSLPLVFSRPAPMLLSEGAMLARIPAWVGLAAIPLILWRLLVLLRKPGRTIWSPHEATLVIGVTFVVLLLTAGPWTYTELLAEIAGGMAGSIGFRALLFGGLLAGAWYGGWTANRFRSRRVTLADVARCFGGGLLMGWGSLILPGGNDNLILVGMPLFYPYAWIGIGTMCVVIAIALQAERRFT